MKASEVVRAAGAAMEVASGLALGVADTRVVQNSNKLALRLLPCDVFARVAFAGHEVLQAELEIGRRLAEAGSPVASLEPRVEPRVYERDGFLETCCRGPAEFDVAHVPEDVSDCYSNADQELLCGCRLLVLAMVAAWRWDPDDQFPDRDYWRVDQLNQLRAALDRYGGMT